MLLRNTAQNLHCIHFTEYSEKLLKFMISCLNKKSWILCSLRNKKSANDIQIKSSFQTIHTLLLLAFLTWTVVMLFFTKDHSGDHASEDHASPFLTPLHEENKKLVVSPVSPLLAIDMGMWWSERLFVLLSFNLDFR